MHRLGVQTHLFRGSPTAVAIACGAAGLDCVQLTPAFPGLMFLEPGHVTPQRCRQAAEPFLAAGLSIACLSAYTNLLDPDLDRRHRGIVRWHALLRHTRDFGTGHVVTETGTLSPQGQPGPWPEDHSTEAWDELCLIVREALRIADDYGSTLLLKPNPTHVLATAADVHRLREEVGHPRLGFVLDPVSFLLGSRRESLAADLERVVEQLAPWSPVVHAKDLAFGPQGMATPRVGCGVLPYSRFFHALDRFQPDAPVILEHVRPEEVAEARAHLQRAWND